MIPLGYGHLGLNELTEAAYSIFLGRGHCNWCWPQVLEAMKSNTNLSSRTIASS